MRTSTVLERNNVTVTGRPDGPTLLLGNGFGVDQDVWRRLLPSFTDDHRVVLFDHVGATGSDESAYDSARYGSLHGYADDLLRICAELDLHDVTYVGHSVGAMIGVLASIADPAPFRDLVLIAPSPRYVDDPADGYVGGFSQADIDGVLESLDTNYTAWAQATAPMVMGNPSRPELGAELTGGFVHTDPTIAREFARVLFTSDHRADLPHVTVPSLVLQCAEDVLAPLAVGEYLGRHLPFSTVVHLAATGHCPQVSAPEETAAAILAHRGRAR